MVISTLRDRILPGHYRTNLTHLVDGDCLLFKQGAYVFLAMPFSRVPSGDYGSNHAKTLIRKLLTCIPVIAEKGLFLLYYGPGTDWQAEAPRFTVDKTACRPVILQAVHFIDPETGVSTNSRTHWGPIKFGFCGRLIDQIELLGNEINEGVAPNDDSASAAAS